MALKHMPTDSGRRRFIGIAAAMSLGALLPLRAHAASHGAFTWRGQALGAPASLSLHGIDEALAHRLVKKVITEVARLEGIFSLYRQDSALATLNRSGALAFPPTELVDLMRSCQRFNVDTSGCFDVTIQPLWRLYAEHFSQNDASPSGPSQEAVTAALAVTGSNNVAISDQRIAFAKSGMALTFNGVAQGFITDRIVNLLKDAGLAHCLVDMGEIAAIGTKADGKSWQVGIADLETEPVDQGVMLADNAIATSSLAGFRFDPEGKFGHILDPRTGAATTLNHRVSVIAPQATTADALATAFCLLPESKIRACLDKYPQSYALIRKNDGTLLRIG